jgi:hypothetical protein
LVPLDTVFPRADGDADDRRSRHGELPHGRVVLQLPDRYEFFFADTNAALPPDIEPARKRAQRSVERDREQDGEDRTQQKRRKEPGAQISTVAPW